MSWIANSFPITILVFYRVPQDIFLRYITIGCWCLIIFSWNELAFQNCFDWVSKTSYDGFFLNEMSSIISDLSFSLEINVDFKMDQVVWTFGPVLTRVILPSFFFLFTEFRRFRPLHWFQPGRRRQPKSILYWDLHREMANCWWSLTMDLSSCDPCGAVDVSESHSGSIAFHSNTPEESSWFCTRVTWQWLPNLERYSSPRTWWLFDKRRLSKNARNLETPQGLVP